MPSYSFFHKRGIRGFHHRFLTDFSFFFLPLERSLYPDSALSSLEIPGCSALSYSASASTPVSAPTAGSLCFFLPPTKGINRRFRSRSFFAFTFFSFFVYTGGLPSISSFLPIPSMRARFFRVGCFGLCSDCSSQAGQMARSERCCPSSPNEEQVSSAATTAS